MRSTPLPARAFVAAPILAAVLTAVVAVPAHAGTYYLDSYDKHKDKYAGPLKTEKLAKGVPYKVQVRGTFSFFNSRDLRASFCGKPEKQPLYKSKGRKNGYVAGDAEWLFADLKKNCAKRGGALTTTRFGAKTATKWVNITPIGGAPKGPTKNHSYKYALLGSGKTARFRLYDAITKDNYGRLKISIKRATPANCANNGFVEWGFADEATCSAAALTVLPDAPKKKKKRKA